MAHSKERLRNRLSSRSLDHEEKKEKDLRIEDRLFNSQKFRDAENFFIYISTEKEVDTHSIITKLLGRGKNVFVPYVEKDRRVMEPVKIQDYPEDLEEGPFRIMQPKKDGSNLVHPEKIEVCVVPGIAFDENGNRVGHGFGYYDRFLKRLDSEIIALAYEFQVVENVDCDPWDVPVDLIITESREINW